MLRALYGRWLGAARRWERRGRWPAKIARPERVERQRTVG